MTSLEINQEREGSRAYATLNVQHISMGGPIRGIAYWAIVIPLFLFAYGKPTFDEATLKSRSPFLIGAVIASFVWGKVVPVPVTNYSSWLDFWSVSSEPLPKNFRALPNCIG